MIILKDGSGVEFSLNMKALLALENKFNKIGFGDLIEVISKGGHSAMVEALSIISGKPTEYFGEWSMLETQELFMKCINVSMYGTEEAPVVDEEAPLDSKKK